MAKQKKISRINFSEVKNASKQINDTPTDSDKTNGAGRVKLTTMVNPALRDKLKIIAVKERRNLSDVLEDAIKKYLGEF